MKNIRIGNDIKIEWSLYDGGSAFILEGRDVKVYLKDKYGRKEITDYVISGNMLTWTFHGKNQRRTGAYSLELVVNENENGMITTDACQFVNLVHCSCDVAGSDDNGVSTETIELRSQLSVGGSSGEGGGSYDDTAIWKAVNNKVDKVVGKGLSTNDYTDAEKSKLAGLKNYDDTKLKEEIAETYATKDYVNEAVANAGGGGCECATPDWSAPEGQNGHIKNRTHYRDNPIEDGSYDESNLSWGDTREIYPYGHKYYKVTINGESHIIDFVGKDWPQYDFEKDEQNKLEYDLQFDHNVGLKLSFFQDGGGYPRLVLEYYPRDPAAPETIDVSITDYYVDFKQLDEEFIPDTIARAAKLTELSAEVSEKQDTISDLETIRSGAAKGATAIQEVKTINGQSIVGSGNIEIQGGGGGGTPSGDPMHYMYEAVGAEWNGTGADIEKQGAYGDTITHKAGYWYLNELGDITTEEMRRIYLYANLDNGAKGITKYLGGIDTRTNIATWTSSWNGKIKDQEAFAYAYNVIVARMRNKEHYIDTNASYAFVGCTALQKILPTLDATATTSFNGVLDQCNNLREVRIKNAKVAIKFDKSPLISKASILYLIQNSAATSAMVITLHADAYARLAEDADIVAALAEKTNVSLAK